LKAIFPLSDLQNNLKTIAMILEHVAIWTNNLELLKDYYVQYFNATSNDKYTNTITGFQSYFLSFVSGARLEIMYMPGIPDNKNETIVWQHKGIIHLAFGVDTMQEVDAKATQLATAGFKILSGPRKTGDGYYEFETLDPDNNRLEVTCRYTEEQ
jgi:lactoylglutathione lyase